MLYSREIIFIPENYIMKMVYSGYYHKVFVLVSIFEMSKFSSFDF